MSTGQAVTMPEGSFTDLTKSPLVFGGSDIPTSHSSSVSGTVDAIAPETDAKENSCVVQNHIGKEVGLSTICFRFSLLFVRM